ncbi:DNA alkylation repair protein [Aquimarina sp. MMG016]|uniref:DNA alkylation repair protein n=1 Tax=Aquimarina sp. MMG016 TaxID=2822690 RepID=UPI001B3A228D|nr:DNA alkylation repair protein [Aquimarina sp. MMG016]MBQ4821614.1 DNA alkylation repair protein [Aquimarina sp. MMG016]
MEFVLVLKSKLERNANAEEARAMEAYMKDLFTYYGIKAPKRKILLKETINEFKGELTRDNVIKVSNTLYQDLHRELHYCAIEIVDRFLRKKYTVNDIQFIEKLIVTNSWWDSVDFIAKHILGNYLLQHPDQIQEVISKFSSSKNMWLNRSAILFQLGYKEKTDAQLLFSLCEKHKSSDDFFIKKAIGWALREYSKVNPEAILSFVSKTKLKPLSEREALKRIQ